MQLLSLGDLSDFLREMVGPEKATISSRAMIPILRGRYGPFVSISGHFANGRHFELAVELDESEIDLEAGTRLLNEVVYVD